MYPNPSDPRPATSSNESQTYTTSPTTATADARPPYSAAPGPSSTAPLPNNMPPPLAYGPPPPSNPAPWYGGGDQRLPSFVSQVSPLGMGGGGGGGGGSAASGVGPPPVPGHVAHAAMHAPPQATGSRIITIFNFLPQSGYEGTPINISCDLNFPQVGPNGQPREGGNRIRLVFGIAAVETAVQAPGGAPSHHGPPDAYLVTAVAPSLHAVGTRTGTGWSVPVFLEAIVDGAGVIERLFLGDFHYLGDSTPKKSRKMLEDSSPHKVASARRRRSDDEPYAVPPIPAGAAAAFIYDSPPPTPQPGLVRTTQMLPTGASGNPFVVRTKARLEIEGDLTTMKCGWSETMWANRRCLVHFTRRQVGATVHASFRAVEEKDWTPNMIVISCLWHDARSECYFTSVDAIYLLECLMATRYTTEEKNRIRRNLESFKPTTLQKNEGQWQDFYAHIMNYPNPKPRNVDKGLKVFPWVHLEQALKKIFGNYSAYINVPFTFNAGVQEPAPQVSYAHNTHASSDALSYSEDRAAAHHAAQHSATTAPTTGAEDLSAYVDPAAYHRQTHTAGSGAGASTSSDTAIYQQASTGDEFGNYVNMSPATTPAPAPGSYSREYQPQLGLYPVAPSTVDPSMGAPSSAPQYTTGAGGAYDSGNMAYAQQQQQQQQPPGSSAGQPPATSSNTRPGSSDVRVYGEQQRGGTQPYPPL